MLEIYNKIVVNDNRVIVTIDHNGVVENFLPWDNNINNKIVID